MLLKELSRERHTALIVVAFTQTLPGVWCPTSLYCQMCFFAANALLKLFVVFFCHSSDSVPLLSFVLYQCRLVLSCNVTGNQKHPMCHGEQTSALCEWCIRGTAVALTNGECGLSHAHFKGNRRNTSQVTAACGRKAH